MFIQKWNNEFTGKFCRSEISILKSHDQIRKIIYHLNNILYFRYEQLNGNAANDVRTGN
jgi:hypothetical protein